MHPEGFLVILLSLFRMPVIINTLHPLPQYKEIITEVIADDARMDYKNCYFRCNTLAISGHNAS